jgi:hypothetical protein
LSTEIIERRYSASLDPVLVPTDNLLKRWAAEERLTGSLHPLEAIRLLHDGAVLGGGDTRVPPEIQILDQLVREMEKHPDSRETAAFVKVWYGDRAPVYLKAQRLGISRTTIYTELKGHLQYVRGRLHGRGVKV